MAPGKLFSLDAYGWQYTRRHGHLLTYLRNRKEPIGYKLSAVEFDGSGSPKAAANSTTAAVDIVSNPDLSACPRNCFRPVGLAFDAQGRLFMSSDSTGEIYVITKSDGSGVNDVKQASPTSGNGSSGSPSGTASSPSPSASTGGAVGNKIGESSYWVVGAAIAGAAMI